MTIDVESYIKGSSFFKWKEMLLLRNWGEFHTPTKEETKNIIHTIGKLGKIRDVFDSPIVITSGIRPLQYNREIGGAFKSAHVQGKAVDFVVKGYTCDEVRDTLEPMLEKLNIRMEKNPGSNWVHVDVNPVLYNRYFNV